MDNNIYNFLYNMIKSYIEKKEIQELWQDYKENRDVELRDRLIDNYSPLLKNIVNNIYYSLPNNVEISDLENYGFIGLMDAINKFDIDRDIKFETYANFRIRGAIIDGIRKIDWLSRTLRTKTKKSSSDKDEYSLSSLDDPGLNLDNEFKESSEKQNDMRFNFFVSDFVDDVNRRVMLFEALKMLKEDERKIIILRYFRYKTFKEISKYFDLTDSMISKIHKKAIRKLRIIINPGIN